MSEKEEGNGPEVVLKSISYSIYNKNKSRNKKSDSSNLLQILKNISVCFKPGELCIIIGATGAGKTSLLDCIMGLKQQKDVQGDVFINGELCSPRKLQEGTGIGYVEQMDSVLPDLTVRENLLFSAKLRLPKLCHVAKIEATVENVIASLALQRVADVLVGDGLRRGISSGEKKRATIGMELVANSAGLVLDEPTTGLDSLTASNIMNHLKKLSNSGKTIICSLHQPRYSIYKVCDNLTILSKGEVVYHGQCQSAVDYFATHNFVCEKYNNPPDFFLDVIESKSDKNINFAELYHSSVEFQQVQAAIKEGCNYQDSTKKSTDKINTKVSFWRQFQLISHRVALTVLRSPTFMMLTLKSNMLLAFLVGAIFYALDDSDTGIENRAGAFFFITMNIVFMNTSTVGHFHTEKHVFIHEKANRYYEVGAYFLAKVACYLLPMQLVPSLAFGGISYVMIGLRPGARHFGIFLLTLCLASITAASMGFFLGTLVSKTTVGNVLFSLLNTLMLVGAGFLMKIKDLGIWAQWLPHISLFRYIMEALSINEFSGNDRFVENPNMASVCSLAEAHLLKQGYNGTRLWIALGMLSLMSFVCLLGTYFNLKRMQRS